MHYASYFSKKPIVYFEKAYLCTLGLSCYGHKFSSFCKVRGLVFMWRLSKIIDFEAFGEAINEGILIPQ